MCGVRTQLGSVCEDFFWDAMPAYPKSHQLDSLRASADIIQPVNSPPEPYVHLSMHTALPLFAHKRWFSILKREEREISSLV